MPPTETPAPSSVVRTPFVRSTAFPSPAVAAATSAGRAGLEDHARAARTSSTAIVVDDGKPAAKWNGRSGLPGASYRFTNPAP
jgi:hypothetical protein